MLGYCPLSSGSKGNCIYIGTESTKVLVDAGISGRATKNKLASLDVDVQDIDAIFITHEHGDHIQGLKVLALRQNIPVFCNLETARAICDYLGDTPDLHIFTTGETFTFRDLQLHPFSIQHDCVDPVAYTVETDYHKLGICTDLGFVTSLVRESLRNSHYLYLEANHQPSMVYACARPNHYKQRVLSRTGHLSNEECAQLITDICHDELKHIYLAHLSGECNNPQLAIDHARAALPSHMSSLPIVVAQQDEPSPPVLFTDQAKVS